MEEAAIAPFSFSKYLMWKDLVDRVSQLEHNRVVRHLIQDPDKPYHADGAGPMPHPHEIDSRYAPEEIVHPLPADSSQLAAVMAASEGHDLVIVGPPGTGKSQTITNLIAQCLATGKTVLFVAEKTAALNVVYRRLREHGLGDCCIELHSNKAERRNFLSQLESSWKNRRKVDASEWLSINQDLRMRRDELNAYAAALHAPDGNGWTAYRAMGEFVRGQQLEAPKLDWPRSVRHDSNQYQGLENTVAQLARTYAALPGSAGIPHLEVTEWSTAWESTLLDHCRGLRENADSLQAALARFAETLGLPSLVSVTAKQLPQIQRLAEELSETVLPPAELLLHPRLEQLTQAVEERRQLLQQSAQAKSALEGALSEFCSALGSPTTGVIPESKKRVLYQLANELVRGELPPRNSSFIRGLKSSKRYWWIDQGNCAIASKHSLDWSRGDSTRRSSSGSRWRRWIRRGTRPLDRSGRFRVGANKVSAKNFRCTCRQESPRSRTSICRF